MFERLKEEERKGEKSENKIMQENEEREAREKLRQQKENKKGNVRRIKGNEGKWMHQNENTRKHGRWRRKGKAKIDQWEGKEKKK